MRGLNLDALRTFAQVIELGSFSAAAERGGITQPAVSLQVRQLERRFGLKLVERVGRRAGPTAAGLELLTHIRAIDTALAQAEQAMTAHASQVAGRLRLGTGATACTYLLPPLLAGLRRRGYTPGSIRLFCERLGVSKSDSRIDYSLLEQALRTIKPGDILLAHLGIWSRQDPWAPAVLEPLIEGLKARGLCFATLRAHPAYADWIATHGA